MHQGFVILGGPETIANHYQTGLFHSSDSSAYAATQADTTHLQHEIMLSPLETALFAAGAIAAAIASSVLASRCHQ